MSQVDPSVPQTLPPMEQCFKFLDFVTKNSTDERDHALVSTIHYAEHPYGGYARVCLLQLWEQWQKAFEEKQT